MRALILNIAERMRATTENERCGGGRHGHAHCLLCGDRNPWSRHVRFSALDGGSVSAEFQTQLELQGYDGILHGGVSSMLLDAAMTHCLFHKGIQAVTGEMNVKFCEPIPCHALIQARAWVVSAWSPLYYMGAELVHENEVKAKATA